MNSIDKSLFLDRFLSYVTYDTQSAEDSQTYPSTLKQLELSKKILLELKELGLKDTEITEHGYVFGTLPSNVDYPVPVIGYTVPYAIGNVLLTVWGALIVSIL